MENHPIILFTYLDDRRLMLRYAGLSVDRSRTARCDVTSPSRSTRVSTRPRVRTALRRCARGATSASHFGLTQKSTVLASRGNCRCDARISNVYAPCGRNIIETDNDGFASNVRL